MDNTLITNLARNLSEFGFRVRRGLKRDEIEDINNAFGAKMPQDLQDMLTICVPAASLGMPGRFPNWHRNPAKIARESKNRIMDGLRFDIAAGDYWCEAFGKRPNDPEKAVAQAQEIVAGWPPLFPIYGHRYMPSEFPGEYSPVISFLQFTDVITYGDNLYDYFINEFGLPLKHISENQILPEDVPYWGPSFNVDNS